jgi:hypothetical protein
VFSDVRVAVHPLFLLIPVIIFTSLAPNASIILDAGDTGWKATLNNQQLSIKAVSKEK